MFFLFIMSLDFPQRSARKILERINESQVSEAKRVEICWTNYPLYKAHGDIPAAKRSGIPPFIRKQMNFRVCLLPQIFLPAKGIIVFKEFNICEK